MNINGIFDHRVHSIHSILRCFRPTSTNFSEYKKKLMSLKSSFWCDHSQGWIGLMRVWEFLCISNNSTVHTYRYLHTLWGKKKFLLHGKHVMILNPRGQYLLIWSDLVWSWQVLNQMYVSVCESVCVIQRWLYVVAQGPNAEIKHLIFLFLLLCFFQLPSPHMSHLIFSHSLPLLAFVHPFFFFFLLPVSICWGIWPLVCFKAGKIIL